MEHEELITKLTNSYHDKLRAYSRTEGKYTEYPTSDRLKEMNILWGHCMGLKEAIETLKNYKVQPSLI